MELTHLSLFSGIGGLDLAAEWAGFKTIGQCEFADYPYTVLQKHWPDVPKWRDIHELTGEDFKKRTGIHRPTVVSGGFPCQPFSQSGKRKGKDDYRFLWPEMLRVISELKPVWVVGENVVGIMSLGIENCLADLERIGYTGGILLFPAEAVGAPFVGNRVFVMAAANGKQRSRMDKDVQDGCANVDIQVHQKWAPVTYDLPVSMGRIFDPPSRGICRNDDGLPEGMDRLKCAGNAVVPQQAYPIFKAIAEIENMLEE